MKANVGDLIKFINVFGEDPQTGVIIKIHYDRDPYDGFRDYIIVLSDTITYIDDTMVIEILCKKFN
jgi:hypothetical protein